MNWMMLIISLWSRPESPPVGPAELDFVRAREAELTGERSARPADGGSAVPGRYVVGFEPGAEAGVLAWARELGGKVAWLDAAGGFAALTLPDKAGQDGDALARAAEAVAGVRYFEPDFRVRAAHIPNDPYFASYQWDKWVMYADRAWDIPASGPVRVAVIDNGVEYVHPDITGCFEPGELGYDFIGNDDDPRPDNTAIPDAFHGTHIAGIIAATMDNSIGVAGWVDAQLLAVRVLDDSGSGSTSVLASGIRWAADHGCRVVNMSLGSPSAPTPVVEACAYAAGRNVVLIAASGNEGQGTINAPAVLSQCIAVGAIAPGSRLATFSNYGAEQEVVAPGVDVASSVPGGAYALASGTSMATPEVTGVAARLLAFDSTLSAVRVRALINASAIDMGSAGRDPTYGFGLVNAWRALELAGELARIGCASTSGGVHRSSLARGAYQPPSWAERVLVFDAAGRRVAEGRVPATLSPGAYFLRLSAAGRVENRRLVMLD